MGMFEQLGSKQQQVSPQQKVQEIKNDPATYLKDRGFSIPENMTDPRSITNYLLQSGQIGGRRMQMAQQILQRMRGRR